MARILAFTAARLCPHRHWMLIKVGLVCRSCGIVRARKPQVVRFNGAA
jgi:hypothetical protein